MCSLVCTSDSTRPTFLFQQFFPPGSTQESLTARPFHIYDAEFLDIIGPNPTLTLLNHTESDPIFHEAPVWYALLCRNPPVCWKISLLICSRYPAKDEMFFVQNAGAPAAGTGLAKSAIVQKISLSAITPLIASQRNASGSVKVQVVDSNPTVINPNGSSFILFRGEK
jgi:gluconolactonase